MRPAYSRVIAGATIPSYYSNPANFQETEIATGKPAQSAAAALRAPINALATLIAATSSSISVRHRNLIIVHIFNRCYPNSYLGVCEFERCCYQRPQQPSIKCRHQYQRHCHLVTRASSVVDSLKHFRQRYRSENLFCYYGLINNSKRQQPVSAASAAIGVDGCVTNTNGHSPSRFTGTCRKRDHSDPTVRTKAGGKTLLSRRTSRWLPVRNIPKELRRQVGILPL